MSEIEMFEGPGGSWYTREFPRPPGYSLFEGLSVRECVQVGNADEQGRILLKVFFEPGDSWALMRVLPKKKGTS